MDNILLSGGKGGGGGSFTEEDNSLKSVTWVKTLEGLGYGLQVGPVDGLRSVYLDDTPLYDADWNPNFQDVAVEWRPGSPSQTLIPGFEDVSATVAVATDVTVAAPVTRTVSAANVGAASVTVKLPQGLYSQNTADNKLEKTTLNFRIQHKLTSSGTWVTVLDKTYNDKTTGAYEETFRISRPSGAGTWDIRVLRVTADSALSTLKNGLQFAYFTEHILESVTYPNVALLAVSLNAAGVNNSRIPTRSVDWVGRIIQVPNTFDTATRKYTSTWNLSTFKNAWCNDPAWVLYDLATDADVGLGLSASQIDVASFYACSIYNSERVAYTGIDGVDYAGPRFSFNGPITEGMSAIDWMKKVASMMNASILWVNGQLTITQDRPDTYVAVFTNANVVDGRFTRSGTPADTRFTVCNVTWNAPADGYKQRVTGVVTDDAAALTRYGYVETNVAAFGCTSLAQAIRYGKWIVDTSLNTTGTISFTVGDIGATLVPGDVVRVYDNEYAGASSAGRLLAGSTTSVINLDRSVSLSADATITIWDQGGVIYSDVAITTTGTASTITLTTPLAAAPSEDAIFQVTTNSISPELYRIISREEQEAGQFTIVAGQYDANKWARVEGTTTLETPHYVSMPLPVVSPPTGLTFTERSVYLDLGVKRTLYINWVPVPQDIVSGYRVSYTVNGGNRIVQDVKMPFIELDIGAGSVQLTVQALSYKTIPSQPVSGTYTMASTEAAGSVLNAPTNLVVLGTAGTTFTTKDLIVQWTNPTSNGSTTNAVARFKVEVYNGATLLRSEYVAPVSPGATQTYTYSYDDNLIDGGPRRSLTVKVYCQDASLKLSSAVTAAFTNSAPVAPASPAASGSVGNIFVTFTAPTDSDYRGTIVWASLTNGFTPASGNVVYDGSDSVVSFKSLGAGVHYIKVAHYDEFGKDYAGTGLNLSAQLTATPASTGGIANGTANPGSGAEGDLFFNTTDGKLWRYHSGAWTTAVPTLDLTGTITTTQITDSAITTPKVATNAITTNKLFVAGRGQEMNADPSMTDLTAWAGGNTPLLSTGITDIPTGGSTAMTNAANVFTTLISTDYIPVDAAFNYRIESTLKQLSGTLGTAYLGIVWYDASKVVLSAAGATGWPSTGTFNYFGITGSAVPTSWTSYSIGFGPNETAKQHPSAKFVRLLVLLNQNATSGSVVAVARHALIRKTTGEVIVDGTLSATKLVANSITAGQIAASTITTSQIAASTIQGGNIAASTITGGNIAATTVTASNIAANTITAAQIAAATITGTQIAAGTIAAGNISAGTITTDRIQVGAVSGSSASLNTSATISAFGAGTTTRSGTISGPSLVTTGRNVTCGFSGNVDVFRSTSAARVINVSAYLELWNTGTGVMFNNQVTIGDFYDTGINIQSHQFGLNGIFVAPAAGTYQVRVYFFVACRDPATGFLDAYITRLDSYGSFYITEIKV